MSLLKKLAGETALYGLSSIVGRLLNYLLVPLYTRTLAPGEYGVVSELYAYVGFLMVIFSYRMESAFFRFGTHEADRERAYTTGLLSLLASTTVFVAAILLFSKPIAAALEYKGHAEYIRWFGLVLAFDCLAELPFARLRLEQRPVRFVSAKLFNIGLTIGLNVFWLVFCPWAAHNGHEWVRAVWSPNLGVAYIFLANVLASGATLLLLLPELLAAFRARFDRDLWQKMLRYAGPLVIVSFAGIVNEMLDRAILTRLLPGTLEENRAQLGIYAANYKLAMLISLFTQAYRYAAEPFFFRHAAEKNALQIQANATKWFTVAAAAGMLGILLFLDLLKGFIGEDFREGLHVVPILLLANVLLGVYYNFSVWYRLKDRTALGAWISAAGAIVTLVLNLWWVPRMGYVGAAWATLVCYFFMAWATWQTGRREYPAPYPLGRMTAYLVAAVAIAGLHFGLKTWLPDLSRPMLLCGGAVLFGAFLGLVWVWEKEELRRLKF